MVKLTAELGFSASRDSRLAGGRVALLALFALLAVACSVQSTAPSPRAASEQRLLIPFLSLSGALIAPAADPTGTPSLASGLQGFQRFVHPVSVASAANDLYVADAGLGRVFRFDVTLNAMTPLPGVAAGDSTRVSVGPDLSLYVLDPPNRRVFRFARNGRLLGTFRDDAQLARPVDLWVDPAGRVFVADGVFNHLVAFSPLGRASYTVLLQGDERKRVMSVAAMTGGKEGFHISDPACGCMARISPSGAVLATFGHQSIAQPGRMAADRYGRLFVADALDGSLKVFSDGQLIADIKAGELGLQRISDVHISEGSVALADDVGARVELMRLAAPARKP